LNNKFSNAGKITLKLYCLREQFGASSWFQIRSEIYLNQNDSFLWQLHNIYSLNCRRLLGTIKCRSWCLSSGSIVDILQWYNDEYLLGQRALEFKKSPGFGNIVVVR
jgi:hypothetical protein